MTLAYVAGCDGDIAQWENRWRTTATELTATKAVPSSDGAPYVGLTAFQQEDADRFFGRDNLVADLMSRLARRRFLGVFGASGCGKSSLLRAGMAASLAAGGAQVVVFTPGRHPLEECAIHLARVIGESPGTLRDEFVTDPRNLHLRIRATGADVVLVVDQFEELFTLCADTRERATFIAALTTATTDPASRTRVVLGVRADFLGHCGQFPTLVTALRDGQALVGPMTTDELRLAITGPAQQAGYRVETALVARLIADASQELGMLPLISHALLQTWRHRQGKTMTVAGYETVGGIEHALARTAEQTYQALGPAEQSLAQQIFLRLTALGDGTEDTKRRVTRDELDHDNTAAVLDTLTRARLITVDHDSVELAHEALIRHWPRLHTWLTDDRDGLRLHHQLTEAAAAWARHQRDDDLLYRGTRLVTWQDRPLNHLNDTERAFLTTSRRATERARTARLRRLRWSLAAMAVVVVVVSLLAGLAVIQTSQIAEERDAALSRQLAVSARGQLQIDPELALLLAIEAVDVKPTAEADAVLRQAVVDSHSLATLRTGDELVVDLATSPDGRQVVTGGIEGGLRVWEKPEHGGAWSVRRELSTADSPAKQPVFSHDGRYLAATTGTPASRGYSVQVWDMRDAGKPVAVRGEFDSVPDIVFAEDGLYAATADAVWRLDPTGAGEPVLVHAHNGEYADQLVGCVLSQDARYVACELKGETFVEYLKGGRETVRLLHARPTSTHAAFSPDGQHVVKGNEDGTLQVWDITNGLEVNLLYAHENRVTSVEYTSDGTAVVSSGNDGTIRITNASAGSESVGGRQDLNSLVLRGHQGVVKNATISQDGRQVASIGSDGTLRLWSATPGVATTFSAGSVAATTFTPDAKHIVTGSQDGTVRLWARDGSDPTVLHNHSTGVGAVAVSPDGRLVASVGVNREVHLWDTVERATVESPRVTGLIGVGFAADGRMVTGDRYGTIRIWNADGSSVRRQFTTDTPWDLDRLTVSPDGTYVAAAQRAGGVLLQRMDRSAETVDIPTASGAVLAFSPDGRELVTGDAEGTVKIWPLDGHGKPRSLYGHRGEITSVSFSPNGRYLATSSHDGTIRIWDTTGNGEPVVCRSYYAQVESVTFSFDGRYLLTTHDDGTVRVQRCEVSGTTAETIAIAISHTTRQLTPDEKKTFGVPQ